MKYRDDLEVTINERQHQLILGTMLGDASTVLQRGAVNPYFTVAHSIKDLAFTQWKYGILETSNLVQYPINKRGVLRTIQHPCLLKYHNMFYKKKVKVVTSEILDQLDEFGLSVLYMDDGSIIRRISRSSGPYYVLATDCFTEAEVDLMRDFINLEFSVEFRKYFTKHKYFELKTTKVSDGRRFADIVDKYIPQCMMRKKYKLPLSEQLKLRMSGIKCQGGII